MSRNLPKQRMRQVFKERLQNVVDHVPLADIKRQQKAAALAADDSEQTGSTSSYQPVTKAGLKNKRTKLTTTSISDLATEPVVRAPPAVMAIQAAAGGNPAKRSKTASYAVRVTTINKGFEKDSY
jgi:hypothetical protein